MPQFKENLKLLPCVFTLPYFKELYGILIMIGNPLSSFD